MGWYWHPDPSKTPSLSNNKNFYRNWSNLLKLDFRVLSCQPVFILNLKTLIEALLMFLELESWCIFGGVCLKSADFCVPVIHVWLLRLCNRQSKIWPRRYAHFVYPYIIQLRRFLVTNMSSNVQKLKRYVLGTGTPVSKNLLARMCFLLWILQQPES